MSVVWVKPKRYREWGDTDKGTKKAQRVYLVRCSDKVNDTPSIAALACPTTDDAPGLPIVERDSKFYDAPADGGVIYEVTIEYSTRSNDPTQNEPDPIARPVLVRLGFDTFEEPVYTFNGLVPLAEDSDGNTVGITASTWLWGNALVNSAGKPFDPSITDSFRDPVLTFTKNVSELPFGSAIEYIDTTNINDFSFTYRGRSYTIAAGQGWLYDMTTEPRYENGAQYEEVTTIIKCRKDGWRRKILDQGLEGFTTGDVTASHPAPKLTDESGEPILMPALLDGFGRPVGGSSGSTTFGTKPVYLKFKRKRETEFADLISLLSE